MGRKVISKTVFICILCFNLLSSGIFASVRKFDASKINVHDQFGRQERHDGYITFQLIPIGGRNIINENSEKMGFFRSHGGRNEISGNFGRNVVPDNNGVRYIMLKNEDIHKILALLTNAGNVHGIRNAGLAPNGAVNGNEFPEFRPVGGEVFRKGNNVRSFNRENVKANKNSFENNLHLSGFRPGTTLKDYLGVDYVGNFAGFGNDGHIKSFGGNSFEDGWKRFNFRNRKRGNFELFGNAKGFSENFHDKQFQRFNEENGNEIFCKGRGGFGYVIVRGNEIKCINSGGFSGLRNKVNEKAGFGRGNHQSGFGNQLKGRNNHIDSFKNQGNGKEKFNDIHFGRFIEPEFESVRVYRENVKQTRFSGQRNTDDGRNTNGENFAADHFTSVTGNINGKGSFEGSQNNTLATAAVNSGQTLLFNDLVNHSVSFSKSEDGHQTFFKETEGSVRDDNKNVSSGDVPTYHDKA